MCNAEMNVCFQKIIDPIIDFAFATGCSCQKILLFITRIVIWRLLLAYSVLIFTDGLLHRFLNCGHLFSATRTLNNTGIWINLKNKWLKLYLSFSTTAFINFIFRDSPFYKYLSIPLILFTRINCILLLFNRSKHPTT